MRSYHSSRPRSVLLLALALLAATTATTLASDHLELLGDDPNLAHLGGEIERIAETSLGKVGVAAIHLESGRGILLRGDERFPMASTYKVPIAVEILTRVDEGKTSLDDLITIKASDHFVTHGAISEYFYTPGAKLTVHNVLDMMLRNSDNIATDLLFREAGGAKPITDGMKAVGASGIRVDRTTRVLIANWLGSDTTVADPIPASEYNQLVSAKAMAALTPSRVAELNRAFNADPRDNATPRAMATLLRKVWQREILSEKSSALLIDIMARCLTGANRLLGALPPGTPVAHKTGTIGETTNDVGVITLPDDAGHVITVVYIKESKLPSNDAMEPVIAQIARAAYDYFLFNRG